MTIALLSILILCVFICGVRCGIALTEAMYRPLFNQRDIDYLEDIFDQK
ncbi:MAG: hypothetical protein H7Z11_20295 [Verrucomicrobia bacterium]|nr:hypothetical protein [Leptolyngbya sp. ES-bin-22]